MNDILSATKGIAAALAASLLVAIAFAFVFRLPIPFWTYIGPFGEASSYGLGVFTVIRQVVMAWFFYGVLGGFVVLLLIGGLTGVIVGRRYTAAKHRNRMIMLWAGAISALPVIFLSTLDLVIGPW